MHPLCCNTRCWYIFLSSTYHLPTNTTQVCFRNDGAKRRFDSSLEPNMDAGPWATQYEHSPLQWINRLKNHDDGTINDMRLASLLWDSNSFNHNDIFNPMIITTTIHILILVALSQPWSIQQHQHSNAFIHGDLTNQVYIEQPLSFCHV